VPGWTADPPKLQDVDVKKMRPAASMAARDLVDAKGLAKLQ
jgi:hypothetical protein